VTLVYDRKAQLQGQPGVHALIVGLSDYQYLPEREQDAQTRTIKMLK
jgi:hypothetical protein